jgi:uncharacterized protein (DUF934 family)
MAVLIKQRRVVADTWRLLKPGADGALPAVPERGDAIVPLALWVARRADLLAYPGRLGVWLDSHEDPAAIAPDLGRFEVVAVNFPKFGDGRGYSIARLLRERHGYGGELRAIGEVARDLLFYMAGCGFDAFALREGENVEEAIAAFSDFSETYQASVAQPLPLFRRRLAGSKA